MENSDDHTPYFDFMHWEQTDDFYVYVHSIGNSGANLMVHNTTGSELRLPWIAVYAP
jgi:hypothetical protein